MTKKSGAMTLAERLVAAQTKSIALYLERQQLEAQRQQLLLRAQQVEFALLELDGEIRVLTALMAESG